jgi:anaerobic selenocysteine-containing dehydrogenase
MSLHLKIIVIIDPRYTATGEITDFHLPLKWRKIKSGEQLWFVYFRIERFAQEN